MARKDMEKLGKQPSAIRKLYEYGKMRKSVLGEDKVFDFSLGNPSVPAPISLKEYLIELITNTDPSILHGYTSASGDSNVKKALVDYLNNKYNLCESEKYIYMTAGAAASLTITINAIIEEQDEIIVFKPYFPEYRVFTESARGTLVEVNSLDNFLPDFYDLERKISNKTKGVIINSPNNPTGVVYKEDVIIKLSKILKEKSLEFNHPIYLISDEPYRELFYGEYDYPFVTKYYDNSIVCYSFSKSLSLPGERIGYILAGSKCDNVDDLFSAICGAGRALGFVCAPALFQYLVEKCVGLTSDINVYKKNLDILYNGLVDIGYDVIKPEGAFYLFVKALEEDAEKFSEVAKNFELLLVPSNSFGVKGYVRISYCVSQETIIGSLPVFKNLYEYYNKR